MHELTQPPVDPIPKLEMILLVVFPLPFGHSVNPKFGRFQTTPSSLSAYANTCWSIYTSHTDPEARRSNWMNMYSVARRRYASALYVTPVPGRVGVRAAV